MLARLSKHGMISIFERSPNQNMQFTGISPNVWHTFQGLPMPRNDIAKITSIKGASSNDLN